MMEDKKVSYYYIRTPVFDPLIAQYDGLYLFGGDWLENLIDLISNDVSAYVNDIVKWHDNEKFEIQITSIYPSQLPEDVKEDLHKIPFEIAHVLKIVERDSRGISEVYIFIPKN